MGGTNTIRDTVGGAGGGASMSAAISATLTVFSASRMRFLIFHSGSRMLHFPYWSQL
ncbi:hypothetical protein D3C83_264470 [compost metagenome]